METDFGALASQQKKIWSALTWQAGRDTSFWMGTPGMMSEGTKDATKPITFVTELTATARGAKCVLTLVQDLQNDGVVGDATLEGNEESIAVDDIEIQVDQLRNAVKSKGRMSEQRTVIQFRAHAKDKLAFWHSEKIDEMLFLTGSGVAFTSKLDGSTRSGTSQLPSIAFAADVAAGTTNRTLYSGTATSTATLTANDKMSWNLLVRAQAFAVRKKIKPIRIKGSNSYLVVMSPEQGRDLKLDNDYKTAVANAGNRGKDNELFTGSFAMVNGLILYEHNKVYTTLGLASSSKWGAAGTVDGARALLVGAQGLGFAKIGDASWDESDNKDYGNKQGVSYACMIGMIKPQYKSLVDSNTTEDFSVVNINTAAAA